MELRLDQASPLPPSAQLRRQLTAAAHEGRLAPGARLPTVRALAERLGLAVNTVARAYRELETDGVIVTRGRAGSFVADSADPVQAEAGRAARDYAARARGLSLELEEAVALLRASWDTAE